MKNKPIGEGYEFFALTTTNGFIGNLTPGEKIASKTVQQKCVGNSIDWKIDTMGETEKEADPSSNKVMKHLRDKGIGVVGTARARRGWPPSALQK
eukprot:13116370-Ditylum_brightwellii.AAC.1